MRPNFEEPLDTAKQLVEPNIKLCMGPGASSGWRDWLLESNNSEYRTLAENMYIPDDWNWGHFYEMVEYYVIGKGTHALMASYLDPYDLAMGRWYRSKENVEVNPYFGFLSNKKWHLNEVTLLH